MKGILNVLDGYIHDDKRLDWLLFLFYEYDSSLILHFFPFLPNTVWLLSLHTS